MYEKDHEKSMQGERDNVTMDLRKAVLEVDKI